ncbi:MAG: precorrin-4 C(11)-methyltransferase [Leptolyngbyaceae bacterium]|nr:precorrin-4 C(11)-methyltransferase [Leptolyngbyaceae bacterium]
MNQTDTLTPLEPKVYIVGAGPGDPDLLTIKAQRIIAHADVILFADSLVPKQIVDMARADAERVRTANKTLEDILPLMIERVQSGCSVVRLHSGDPSLYGAVCEQMQALASAHIPFEIIPGISAFQLAAARLNVELTVPELVQTIILTRISGRTSVPETEELASLAAHQASLCLYLSARHVTDAEAKLLLHYPPSTPVAVCFRLGWPDERIVLTSLDRMAMVTQQENLIRTTLYVISPALTTAYPPEQWIEGSGWSLRDEGERRSRLYSPSHSHLFRTSHSSSGTPSSGTPSGAASEATSRE